MIKKLLIMPIIGLLGMGLYASADTVDGFTSDSEIYITTCSSSNDSIDCENNFYGDEEPIDGFESPFYVCYYDLDNSVYSCSIHDSIGTDPYSWYSDYSNYKVFVSDNEITYSSSSDNDSSSIAFPGIPGSFTTGITTLVNNFGSTVANWLPTIILVALGITAIFALFRVVRRYAKKSFKG